MACHSFSQGPSRECIVTGRNVSGKTWRCHGFFLELTNGESQGGSGPWDQPRQGHLRLWIGGRLGSLTICPCSYSSFQSMDWKKMRGSRCRWKCGGKESINKEGSGRNAEVCYSRLLCASLFALDHFDFRGQEKGQKWWLRVDASETMPEASRGLWPAIGLWPITQLFIESSSAEKYFCLPPRRFSAQRTWSAMIQNSRKEHFWFLNLVAELIFCYCGIWISLL